MTTSCAEIVTGVDRLLKLINENAEITLTSAANHLRVDRGIVDQWSEILEEEGLIRTEFTITEKILFSLHKEITTPKQESKLMRALKRHVKTLTLERQFNEKELKEREKELKRCMEAVDKKIEVVKRYEKIRDETLKEKEEISKARDRLESERKTLVQGRESLAKTQEKIDEKLTKIATADTELKQREKALREGEKHLAKSQKDIASRIKLIEEREKEFGIIAKRLHKIIA